MWWYSLGIKKFKYRRHAPAVVVASNASWSFYPEPLQHFEVAHGRVPIKCVLNLQSHSEFLRLQAPGWLRGVFWLWQQHTHVCCCHKSVTNSNSQINEDDAANANMLTTIRACLKHALQRSLMKEQIRWHLTSLQDGVWQIGHAADERVKNFFIIAMERFFSL